ncbi:hypothetical protein KR018_003654 [Drosophila ironensis]|nr:hypothetical protein KR018_003654 [Drosophila ironensis]
MDPQQQFCLKWNSYSSNLAITFSNLFKSDVLADVTLYCDGAVFKAHKLILAACSKKFADLFENTPTNGQCVIILEATTPENMAALLEFMYKGEVHVSQEALNSFLKSAESLQVKGLSTETGRLAAQQAQQQHMGDNSPLDSPTGRRSMRNSLSGGNGGNILPGGVGVGLGGGAGPNSIPGALGNGNGLSLAGALSAAGGMAAAASVAASGLSALAASANALDRCSSAGGNIISGTAAGIGALSGVSGSGAGGIGGVGVGVGGNGVGGNNGPISLGSGAGAAMHLGGSTGSLKQECDSLMHPSSSSSSSGMGYTPVPPIYRPISYEPLRKRALRSPYAEQELRGSVLRDGKNSSSECPSPINKPPYHRPSSSASSTAPTEADTMHSERASPQSSRYENHSPSTTAGNGNANSGLDRIVKSERNNGSANEANEDDRELMDESTDNGAEDLRVKLENSNYSPPPPPNSNTSSTTPTNALLENLKNADGSLSGNLAASIAPADMLNVWNATKMNNKNSVNTADGKKLKCLYCDRLYGYETNLRAHIRQRHQGIRVPCPFCERTFTRNNTEAAATAAAAVVMGAHKEAAKQRKRKSLNMALEKCMQRRDALVAEATTTGGGEAGAAGSIEGAGAGARARESGSAGTESTALLTYEEQQQRMHQELAQQIKAAMAAERAQEAMDSTMNTTNTSTMTTAGTVTTTTTTTGSPSDGSSDAEASYGSERRMEVDEQPPEPQPGSELLVVEPKIEVLSESEDDEREDDEELHRLQMSSEPEIQAEAVYDRMPSTPTSPIQEPHIIPPNEMPALTSTPKDKVEQ